MFHSTTLEWQSSMQQRVNVSVIGFNADIVITHISHEVGPDFDWHCQEFHFENTIWIYFRCPVRHFVSQCKITLLVRQNYLFSKSRMWAYPADAPSITKNMTTVVTPTCPSLLFVFPHINFSHIVIKIHKIMPCKCQTPKAKQYRFFHKMQAVFHEIGQL